MQSLDPRVIALWRLEGVVALFTSWLPVWAVAGWLLYGKFGFVIALGGVGGLFVVMLLRALVWPGLAWRNFRYELRPGELLVEQGVLLRQTICVPRSRIQHVDTRQGFWERLFHVSRLLVYTGAGLSGDASLPGLDADEAVRLRDELARTGGGDDDGV